MGFQSSALKKRLRSFSRKDIFDYFHARYNPANMTFGRGRRFQISAEMKKKD